MSRRPSVPAFALLAVVAMASLCSCRSAALDPAPLDVGHATCGYCRMEVSDPRFASQLVVPAEDPRFFDDLGCLSRYLAEAQDLPPQARVYVADHRTRAWIPAERAVFTRAVALTAAMGSHIIAHESVASRDADPDAVGGTPVDPATVLGRGRLTKEEP